MFAAHTAFLVGAEPVMKCDLYKGLQPTVDNIAGNLIGLKGFAVIILLVLAVGLVFFAATRHRKVIMTTMGVMLGALILIPAIPAIVSIVGGSTC